jgi:hypothetical protein
MGVGHLEQRAQASRGFPSRREADEFAVMTLKSLEIGADLSVLLRDFGPPADPDLRKHAQDGGCSGAGDAAIVKRSRDLDQIGA